MNLAFSILSQAASAETEGVVDRLQSYVATDTLTIAEQQLADPDYWGSVGIITLTGMLVVFAILGLLIFLFWGMGKIFQTIDKKKAEKAQAEKASAPVETAATVEETVEEYTDDDEVIAVISAAIAAYSAQDGKSYEIRSIRRKDNRSRSAWSLAGIGDNTRPF